MERKQTHYDTLGVSMTASSSEIKKAYRKLALKCHPDKAKGDHGLTEMFKKINEAHAVLTDDTQRRKYDLTIKPQPSRTVFQSTTTTWTSRSTHVPTQSQARTNPMPKTRPFSGGANQYTSPYNDHDPFDNTYSKSETRYPQGAFREFTATSSASSMFTGTRPTPQQAPRQTPSGSSFQRVNPQSEAKEQSSRTSAPGASSQPQTSATPASWRKQTQNFTHKNFGASFNSTPVNDHKDHNASEYQHQTSSDIPPPEPRSKTRVSDPPLRFSMSDIPLAFKPSPANIHTGKHQRDRKGNYIRRNMTAQIFRDAPHSNHDFVRFYSIRGQGDNLPFNMGSQEQAIPETGSWRHSRQNDPFKNRGDRSFQYSENYSQQRHEYHFSNEQADQPPLQHRNQPHVHPSTHSRLYQEPPSSRAGMRSRVEENDAAEIKFMNSSRNLNSNEFFEQHIFNRNHLTPDDTSDYSTTHDEFSKDTRSETFHEGSSHEATEGEDFEAPGSQSEEEELGMSGEEDIIDDDELLEIDEEEFTNVKAKRAREHTTTDATREGNPFKKLRTDIPKSNDPNLTMDNVRLDDTKEEKPSFDESAKGQDEVKDAATKSESDHEAHPKKRKRAVESSAAAGTAGETKDAIGDDLFDMQDLGRNPPFTQTHGNISLDNLKKVPPINSNTKPMDGVKGQFDMSPMRENLPEESPAKRHQKDPIKQMPASRTKEGTRSASGSVTAPTVSPETPHPSTSQPFPTMASQSPEAPAILTMEYLGLVKEVDDQIEGNKMNGNKPDAQKKEDETEEYLTFICPPAPNVDFNPISKKRWNKYLIERAQWHRDFKNWNEMTLKQLADMVYRFNKFQGDVLSDDNKGVYDKYIQAHEEINQKRARALAEYRHVESDYKELCKIRRATKIESNTSAKMDK
ncbi:Chaperone protein DnaJ [Cyberlindnera fabianii]|uniref:Chaperone protein DnaJ n=1 Tax=Cyberlindnera fabianii TaxID=36022 RepID=A0A1V2LCD6_CYBFA|nr:Chaperone protein DnaJ [Cyberlindnera fabianii]